MAWHGWDIMILITPHHYGMAQHGMAWYGWDNMILITLKKHDGMAQHGKAWNGTT
jgi:hypothetical protein